LDPIELLSQYYEPGSDTFRILVRHGREVAEKALAAAERVPHLSPDPIFIQTAAMLHDIGIFMIHAPGLGCHGKFPYVCHGYLGRELLEERGFSELARVCERHMGVGVTRADIRNQNLPLPLRDMVPISIEEQIICYADKFYSKRPAGGSRKKTVEEIKQDLLAFGPDKVRRFEHWDDVFNGKGQDAA